MDRLVRVERDDGTVIEYTYDAAGNRLTKDVTAGTAAPIAPATSPPSGPAAGNRPGPPVRQFTGNHHVRQKTRCSLGR